MDSDILTEVPSTLKRLIRYIVRGFYSIEHALIVDMLVHHPCMKEDDMLELLKFERKQLRSLIVSLRTDKFIKVRMRVETDAEGRNTKHNYYFINYSTFVNVVKYKLDIMRKKIEMEERDSTSRASFKCPACNKTFTDLEADQLFDPSMGQFMCTFCQSEVEEEATSQPKTDARTLMVKFNEQISPVFALLREVEDVKLSHALLEPEPVDIKSLTGNKHTTHNKAAVGQKWSGEATRNTGFGEQENKITIDMSDSAEQSKAEKLPSKETPVWIYSSTVEGATQESFRPEATTSTVVEDTKGVDSQKNDDIMRTLLAHEKKSSSVSKALPSSAPPGSDDDASTSEEEDEVKPKSQSSYMKPTPLSTTQAIGGDVEEMDTDDDEDATPMVSIGNMRVPYSEVTEDMVDRMTLTEKDEYIRIGQELYETMYD